MELSLHNRTHVQVESEGRTSHTFELAAILVDENLETLGESISKRFSQKTVRRLQLRLQRIASTWFWIRIWMLSSGKLCVVQKVF